MAQTNTDTNNNESFRDGDFFRVCQSDMCTTDDYFDFEMGIEIHEAKESSKKKVYARTNADLKVNLLVGHESVESLLHKQFITTELKVLKYVADSGLPFDMIFDPDCQWAKAFRLAIKEEDESEMSKEKFTSLMSTIGFFSIGNSYDVHDDALMKKHVKDNMIALKENKQINKCIKLNICIH